MRLWHIDLIPVLPNSQLVAQWRELNSIFKNQPSHILINYVYKYPKCYLFDYSNVVIREMERRGFTIRSKENYYRYTDCVFVDNCRHKFPEHNNRYLLQCFYNLQEKYDRGQKDFDATTMNNIKKIVETIIGERLR